MPMTIERMRVLMGEITENLDRVQERGLADGTQTGILNAQMALGGKRALEELDRKISAEVLAAQLNLPMSFIDRKRVQREEVRVGRRETAA